MNNFEKTISVMNVYQLKLKCKQLKIKGYSKLRKAELKRKIFNYYKEQQKEEIAKQKGLFVYDDIISIIYQYVDVDDIHTKRKEMIFNSKRELKKIKNILYSEMKYIKRITSKKKYVRDNYPEYKSYYNMLKQFKSFKILNKSIITLNNKKTTKEELKIWLQTLKITVNGGIGKKKKRELLYIVNENYDIIMNA